MNLGQEADLEALAGHPVWKDACRLRRDIWGRKVFLRGIVEFSNYCVQNCLYCGLRRDNACVERYRLGPDDVFACAAQVKKLGFGTVVLQSGEDPDYHADTLARLVARIKKDLDLAVTLSVGERGRADFALWRNAGADRYLLKAETMNPALYARLRPGKQLAARLEALSMLSELGYEVGSGLIAGLPGDTHCAHGPEQEADDATDQSIAALAAFAPDMFSISPFQPHPDTPLGKQSACSVAHTLRCMALARVSLPHTHIPVTSALSLAGEATRLIALEVGDVLMPSLTPEAVRAAYAIYPGKNASQDEPVDRALAMKASVLDAGFEVPKGPGGAWRGPVCMNAEEKP